MQEHFFEKTNEHKHTWAEIKKYEEIWQRRCYMPSGDGVHAIHVCELCHQTNCVDRIPGGHYLCLWCKNKMKLPKEETVIKWGERGLMNAKDMSPERALRFHPSEPAKIERNKAWKKVIKEEYMVALFNKNFEYK